MFSVNARMDKYLESTQFDATAERDLIRDAQAKLTRLTARVAELEAILKTVLAREAATIQRYDAKLESTEAKVVGLEVKLKASEFVGKRAFDCLQGAHKDIEAAERERDEARAVVKAAKDLFSTCKNEMTARNLPLEWHVDSAMGRMECALKALGIENS